MKKGSSVKRAGNYAVFLLKNGLWDLFWLAMCIFPPVAKFFDGVSLFYWELLTVPFTILFIAFPLFPYVCNWHEFVGCQCRICGKTRDEGHDLDGCKCRRCGEMKHDLDICSCRRCGSVIHDWEEQTRTIHTEEGEEDGYGGWIGRYTEETITYRCRRCGEERTEVNKVEYE